MRIVGVLRGEIADIPNQVKSSTGASGKFAPAKRGISPQGALSEAPHGDSREEDTPIF